MALPAERYYKGFSRSRSEQSSINTPPPIDQATLARFLTDGYFLSHVKRMRKLYSEHREFFVEYFNQFLGNRFTLQVPEAGLHFVAWFRGQGNLELRRRVGARLGINPIPLSFFCIRAKLEPALIFGFAAWSRAQIREGLVKLASALEREETAAS